MTRQFILLVSVILFACSCNQGEQKVSKEEAEKFSAELEHAALKHQEGFLTSAIIYTALSDRMQSQQEISFNENIETSLKKALRRNELEKTLFYVMGKNGTYEKIKIYEKDGRQHVIFRVFGEGGINYMDMELTKLDKKVGIADMFTFTAGENISTTFAELYQKSSHVSEKEDAYIAQRMQAVQRLIQNQDFVQAKTQYGFLPASVRNSRIGNVLQMHILTKLDDENSKSELAALENKLESDPKLQLVMIDNYLNKKDYKRAMNAIDKVDSILNKDSFLDYYRGLISYMSGDKNTAQDYYKKVTVNNPNFPGAFAELFAMSILKDEKDDAKKYFSSYKQLRNSDKQLVKQYEEAYPYLKEASSTTE